MVFPDFSQKIMDRFLMNACGDPAGNIAIFAIKEQQEAERANGTIDGFHGLNVAPMNEYKRLLFRALLNNYRL